MVRPPRVPIVANARVRRCCPTWLFAPNTSCAQDRLSGQSWMLLTCSASRPSKVRMTPSTQPSRLEPMGWRAVTSFGDTEALWRATAWWVFSSHPACAPEKRVTGTRASPQGLSRRPCYPPWVFSLGFTDLCVMLCVCVCVHHGSHFPTLDERPSAAYPGRTP